MLRTSLDTGLAGDGGRGERGRGGGGGGGRGGRGGGRAWAATMAGAVFLGFEGDPARLRRRVAQRYLDEEAPSLDAALKRVEEAREKGEALSIGVVMNAADPPPELVRRRVKQDLVTDQTSAHDP